MGWRSSKSIDNVVIDYNTVRVSGVTNMYDLRRVLEICRENSMHHLPEFVEEFGTSALYELLKEVDWDTAAVDESVLDDLD